ncbi:MAG: phosphatidate cytidylyltransferase [Kofleriaceae bacterium]|nr:phosphatidate cytidylyltransferase [Kofleriaceae bacterium]MCL4226373.1 phosphatidate cytidylyltransferase [Myxococcales bacterium]
MALGNLASRVLVAVVAAPLLLLAFYQQSHVPTFFLVYAAALLAMWELFGMMLDDRRDRIASMIFGGLAVAAYYWIHPAALPDRLPWSRLGDSRHLVLVLAVIGPGLYYLFRFGDLASVSRRMAATTFGIVYAGVLLIMAAELKRDVGGTQGGHMILFVLIVVWLGDTGAYFAGRFLGKAKLYEAVSPKKTWAGAFGGLAGSLAGALLMKAFFLDVLSWVDVVLITVPGAALAQMGDLAESLIKRSTGVKDSGAILPGHGGILDRIDAVLYFAPWVYVYVQARAFVDAL